MLFALGLELDRGGVQPQASGSFLDNHICTKSVSRYQVKEQLEAVKYLKKRIRRAEQTSENGDEGNRVIEAGNVDPAHLACDKSATARQEGCADSVRTAEHVRDTPESGDRPFLPHVNSSKRKFSSSEGSELCEDWSVIGSDLLHDQEKSPSVKRNIGPYCQRMRDRWNKKRRANESLRTGGSLYASTVSYLSRSGKLTKTSILLYQGINEL